ncbi:hypothetical protein [Shimia abyssi]|uniref:Uncharacterized protein n=1 Tax=Shimia abyssi TaxID=1662395 RepID=A0A2P8F7D2_9RHOB|nr:hypothetical protein [Shimia abyssi]PSL17626.1 hypothetical protein CLV88_11673 [Shimia abyssi]
MDHTQIQEALGLASSAVGISDKATKTIRAVETQLNYGSVEVEGALAELIAQLVVELTTANITNTQLYEVVKNLNRKFHENVAFEQEKARYEMVETAEGDYVFRIKDHMVDEQPIHYICPVCLNQDKRISYIAGRHRRVCQTNRKHVFSFGKKPPVIRTRVRH